MNALSKQEAFGTLGLHSSASRDEVTSAYRKLAKKAHPDVGGSEKDFIVLQQAYDKIVNDKITRLTQAEAKAMWSQIFSQPKNREAADKMLSHMTESNTTMDRILTIADEIGDINKRIQEKIALRKAKRSGKVVDLNEYKAEKEKTLFSPIAAKVYKPFSKEQRLQISHSSVAPNYVGTLRQRLAAKPLNASARLLTQQSLQNTFDAQKYMQKNIQLTFALLSRMKGSETVSKMKEILDTMHKNCVKRMRNIARISQNKIPREKATEYISGLHSKYSKENGILERYLGKIEKVYGTQDTERGV